MAKITEEKIGYKLQGATDEEIEFLLSRPDLATEEQRAQYQAAIATMKVKLNEELNKAQAKLNDNINEGISYENMLIQGQKEYRDLMLNDLKTLKVKGEEINLKDYKNPFYPENPLFNDSQINILNNTKKYNEDEFNNLKAKRYDRLVKRDKVDDLNFNDMSNLFYGTGKKRNNIESDEKGDIKLTVWEKVEKRNFSIDEVYDKIYDLRKRDDDSLEKDDFENVLDLSDIDIKYKEKIRFYGELGISQNQMKEILPEIKQYKKYQKDVQMMNSSLETINSNEHKDLIQQYKDLGSDLNEFKKLNLEERKRLTEDAVSIHKELAPFEENEKALNNYVDLSNKIKEKLEANTANNGDLYYKDEVIGEYQSKLSKYNKFSNAEKKAHADMKEELDVYKGYFEKNNIDTTEPRFTRQEKEAIGGWRVALDRLRDDKKAYKEAYDKENGFIKFIGQFLPNSWTSLGRMRDKINKNQAAAKEFGNLSDETIEKYERFIDSKEEDYPDNPEIVNKAKIHLFDRYVKASEIKKSIDPNAAEKLQEKAFLDKYGSLEDFIKAAFPKDNKVDENLEQSKSESNEKVIEEDQKVNGNKVNSSLNSDDIEELNKHAKETKNIINGENYSQNLFEAPKDNNNEIVKMPLKIQDDLENSSPTYYNNNSEIPENENSIGEIASGGNAK